MSDEAAAGVCEVLGEHLTPIPVVDETLRVIGYYCGACGIVAGPDRVFPPPGEPEARRCAGCDGPMPEDGGYLVPLEGERGLEIDLVRACAPRCVATLLGVELPPEEEDPGPPDVTGEAAEEWRRWLADPKNHYHGPEFPA